MFTSLPSSHGNMDGKDQGVDNKIGDVSVTAEGRFIVPTSTLDRISSMGSTVTVSPFSWDFTLDDSSDAAALANKYFHLESLEMFDDDDTQSTEVCKEDGEEVMQHSQHDTSTSSPPSMPFKVSPFTYYCSSI